ncbi:hypothetical protein HPP92_004169 [Vanilla planifolia]|uniref:Pentatricopeptide repeat-containing protein n=1 Tax=Vanilla planifolia TaxID=51239 RepID=A0A835VM60_VANPL|nr:hypothetical protein HPP92_004169 [Vanilla planifolia]
MPPLASLSRLHFLLRRYPPLSVFNAHSHLLSHFVSPMIPLSNPLLLSPDSIRCLLFSFHFPCHSLSSDCSTAAISESCTDPNELTADNSVITNDSITYVLKKLSKIPEKALNFFNFAVTTYDLRPGPSAYNLMLRILAHKDHLTDFWSFLKSMQDHGHQLDHDVYQTILASFKNQKLIKESFALSEFYSSAVKKSSVYASVSSAANIVLDAEDWSQEVEKNLRQFKLSLSEDFVAKVLRDVRESPSKALHFFRWTAQTSKYKHGSIAYNAMARVLGREDSIGEFWSLVRSMKAEGHDMDIDTYVKLTRQFIKRKMMKDAVELYEFMMDGPYKPAIQDCGLLLRQISLSPAPDLDLVSRVVKKYEASGYSLSKVIYDGIHRSLTSTGNFEKAFEIMKRMRQEGFEPDNITYSQLVYGLCKAKRLDEACKILDEMEEGGCMPDLKTWTVLIQGHCLAGEVDKALECLTKMIEKSYECDADLLDVLVRGLSSKRRTNSAYTLMLEMVDTARVRPWQATYKYLIQELLAVAKFEEALKLLGLMKNSKFPPFAEPFVAHISKFGTTEDAKDFLKVLTGKTYPSPAAYLHLFKAFFEQGRYTEAQDLLFKCPHHIRKNSDISKLFGSVKVGAAT